ncbi:MAG TPA: DUF3095 domain-containing protein [Candidatus Margulisiibacteriota bacterium]|nr:DUF3095 domain-containing protein [Candidatus Margulisiibacteriota bacterium]
MSSESFYAALPLLTSFDAITEPGNYAPLPGDWHVATCDVRNSTRAVEAGNYKHVNTVGAAAVTAMLNAAGATEIPFVFEGDGSAFCVPPALLEDAKAALVKTQDMAQRSFGLELRVATLLVAKIREAGHDILVSRVRVSENYIQAAFAGGGMAFADRYMKDPKTAPLCEVKPGSVEARGSLEGLECRWQDIRSRHGETVSLMVRALETEPTRAAALYRKVIAKVHKVYGSDEASHPLTPPVMTLLPTLSARQLGNEVGVRAADRGPLGKWLWLMRARWFVLLGWVLMKFGLKTQETDWSTYKDTLLRNTDVRKFNDIYRQILAGNAQQREALDAWLAEGYARRELVYGLHVTDRAHMTCLVFNYSGRHLHFIDGADGGLFLAAKQFKERAAKLI